jgi:hypothetical protein
MTKIVQKHVDWAVVDRLRQMLETPNSQFSVTHTFALFSSIVCWVMQHVRIPKKHTRTSADCAAANLGEKLETGTISDDPWHVLMVERVVLGAAVPAPVNFDGHSPLKFLINLRDAMAHGDGRNVKPFNRRSNGEDHDLLGFTFKCEEPGGGRPATWSGEITLLESDMRHIGGELARLYCDAVSGGPGSDFAIAAKRHVHEKAA